MCVFTGSSYQIPNELTTSIPPLEESPKGISGPATICFYCTWYSHSSTQDLTMPCQTLVNARSLHEVAKYHAFNVISKNILILQEWDFT